MKASGRFLARNLTIPNLLDIHRGWRIAESLRHWLLRFGMEDQREPVSAAHGLPVFRLQSAPRILRDDPIVDDSNRIAVVDCNRTFEHDHLRSDPRYPDQPERNERSRASRRSPTDRMASQAVESLIRRPPDNQESGKISGRRCQVRDGIQSSS